jgi:tRNA (guanine-N7-)-methyltransferase
MAIRPEYRNKPIRSYVVRAGRMTNSQRSAFGPRWERYGLKLADGQIDLEKLFQRTGKKVLEIGFGMGDSLLQMAMQQPDIDFVGIEVHPPGVGSLVNAAAEADIDNLRLYLADANDVINECLAPNSLDRVQLYFPDPWHKKKHHKRRIVQPQFLQLIRAKLKPAGVLHIATDWQPYAEHILDLIDQAPGFNNSAGTGHFIPRPEYRPLTKFEKRGQGLGHGVWDVMAEKTH